MTRGTPVEVNILWGASGHGLPPCRSWFGGYVFDRFEATRAPFVGVDVLVRPTAGLFKGCLVRYAHRDVREIGRRA